jgi:hypothetical protein
MGGGGADAGLRSLAQMPALGQPASPEPPTGAASRSPGARSRLPSIDALDRAEQKILFPLRPPHAPFMRPCSFSSPVGAFMSYDNDDAVETSDGVLDDEAPTIEERLTSLRAQRGGAGYSPQARQRIEYLLELRRLRAQAGDDAIDTF